MLQRLRNSQKSRGPDCQYAWCGRGKSLPYVYPPPRQTEHRVGVEKDKLTGQDCQGRALARAVDTKQTEALPVRNAERRALHGNLDPLGQRVDLAESADLCVRGDGRGQWCVRGI